MPETEPVEVAITANAEPMRAGMEQAKASLRSFGDEADNTSRKTFKLARESTSLLASVLAIRGAFSITGRILEDFGVKNEYVERTLKGLEVALNVGVAALSVYRVASSATAAIEFLRAKAHFLAAIAQVSAGTLFLGTAFAVAVALAAWTSMANAATPHAQFGGIIPARQGGTAVIAGEAGQPEAILPLSRARDFGFGSGGITVNGPLIGSITTDDPDYVMRTLGRRIDQLKASGA